MVASQTGRCGGGHPGDAAPIRSHAIFIPAVAIWFAALFGLGSLAAHVRLVEAAVLSLHLDLLIAAAAPPLGMTARALIAGGLALCGGALGFLLARTIAVSHRGGDEQAEAAEPATTSGLRTRDAHPDAPACRPVLVHDEIGEVEAVWDGDLEPPAILSEPAPAMVAHVEEAADRLSGSLPVPPTEPAVPAPTAAERIAAADLAGLSYVEMIERLALSMQRRNAARPAPARAEPGEPFLVFPGRNERREALQALITPPPVSQASRPTPKDTERALREALTTLQRMSGAA